MKKTIRILVVLLVLLGAAFLLFRTPDTDRAEMITKYSNESSRFLDDGQGGKIHYRDEGNRDGPALLLIHGSNSLLQTWEPLVALLGNKYRMISLDLYGHGLTGPSPTGAYDAETNRLSPVISAGASTFINAKIVGATSLSLPPWRTCSFCVPT